MDATERAWLRSWLGAEPDDEDLDARYARLEDAQAVALEVVRERRAALLATPSSFTVTGVYSESNSGRADELKNLLADLLRDPGPSAAAVQGGSSVLVVVPAVRRRSR